MRCSLDWTYTDAIRVEFAGVGDIWYRLYSRYFTRVTTEKSCARSINFISRELHLGKQGSRKYHTVCWTLGGSDPTRKVEKPWKWLRNRAGDKGYIIHAPTLPLGLGCLHETWAQNGEQVRYDWLFQKYRRKLNSRVLMCLYGMPYHSESALCANTSFYLPNLIAACYCLLYRLDGTEQSLQWRWKCTDDTKAKTVASSEPSEPDQRSRLMAPMSARTFNRQLYVTGPLLVNVCIFHQLGVESLDKVVIYPNYVYCTVVILWAIASHPMSKVWTVTETDITVFSCILPWIKSKYRLAL